MKHYAPIKLSDNISATPEGFLLCAGVSIGRVGDMEYGQGETPLDVGKDGKVTVSRNEEELFKPETIASFEGKPLTIKHPTEFVDPSNWKELAVGVIQNVRRGEGEQKDDLVADIMVTDAVAIGLIKSGLREVSCGYEAEYIDLGNGKGKQTDIIGNHLALVEEGRAGPSYAIRDHKGGKEAQSMKNKFKEKIKEMFSKTADEAAKAIDEMPDVVTDEDKEEKKEESEDAGAYDELMGLMKDVMSKCEALKPKDAAPEEKKEEEKAADADPLAPAKSVEERLKALEDLVAKVMKAESAESEVIADEKEDKEEAKDDEAEEETMTGDEKARVEILAPGFAPKKNGKAAALKKCYETADGKRIIDAICQGKAPAFDKAETVDLLFVSASEILKSMRTNDLANARKVVTTDKANVLNGSIGLTADEMNERNKKHYGLN